MIDEEIEATSEAREAEAKQYRDVQRRKRRQRGKPEKASYKRVNNKVVKIVETPNGNKYSYYCGPYGKFKHLLGE